MRVLFWSSGFWPKLGGVERLATQLLIGLSSGGHRFEVISGVPGPVRFHEIPVHRLPLATSMAEVDGLAKVLSEIGTIKKRFQPDLVHLFGINLDAALHLFTESAWPCPTIASLHGRWPHIDGGNSVVSKVLTTSTRVVGCSRWILNEALVLQPEIEPRSLLIPNAVLPFAEPSASRAESAPVPFRVGCLGRLSPEKGFDIAVRTVARLRSKYPEIELWIGGEGPEAEGLSSLAQGLGAPTRFVGRVDECDVPEWLASMSVILIPSRTEGFGLVALESALAGRPVIASRTGGLPEVVVHRCTGLLVEPEDEQVWAYSLSALLDAPGQANRLGALARKRAAEQFRWPVYIDQYDQLYRASR